LNEVVPWISAAIALSALIYTIVANRQKAQTLTVIALAGKVDILEDRCTRIESDLKHLPNKDDATEIKLSLAELKGEVAALTASFKPVAAMASRLQEHLIDRFGQ